MQFQTVANGEVNLNVAVQGEGPLILCVHGWPELWYSWRHQMDYFAERGYRVAAMDVRGYGDSSAPHAIENYTLREIGSDVAAVARALSDEPVVLFGHDWGAPIVYATTLLHPREVRAVAGLSVPFMPFGEGSFLDVAREIYADRFFYQLYFQQEGVVEGEVERNFSVALRKIYYSLCGDAPLNDWLKTKPADAGLLDELLDPDPFPGWLSPDDLAVFVAAFEKSGFRGPANRYRAQVFDPGQLVDVQGQTIPVPGCFIGGERDAVRAFVPGGDLYADPGAGYERYLGTTLIPGAGHWVQQEKPAETNAALAAFLEAVERQEHAS